MSDFTGTQWFVLLMALIMLVGYGLHLAFRAEKEVKKERTTVEEWMNLPQNRNSPTPLLWGYRAEEERPEDAVAPTESGVPPKLPADR
jgi:hypothetical protein